METYIKILIGASTILVVGYFAKSKKAKKNEKKIIDLVSIAHASLPNDGKIGILMCNLGTPDAPTRSSVYTYLREFLSDIRVVDISRYIWYPILYLIILPFRSGNSAKKYESVWLSDRGSPLMYYSNNQKNQIYNIINKKYNISNIYIELAMRYGNPSINDGLNNLLLKKINKLLIIPMYPQPANATTMSVADSVFENLKKYKYIPEIRYINGFATHPAYIRALANSAKKFWEAHETPDMLLISFHGVPKRLLSEGDPYFNYCMATANALKEQISIKCEVAFQSRFGSEEWLQPYAEDVIQGLPKKNIKKLDVICPGFSVDCLETIEEIGDEYYHIFLESGGEKYNLIPCLNDSIENEKMFSELLPEWLSGWV
eukprot:GHVL01012129.1.p1 GENE.GHVL01012129.1~~GHVL01012129.1.p1  ORF type:complete len:388 (-),score=97.80 GHVL01012129.1:759-1877(-)